MDVNLSQPRCSREGLGLSTGWVHGPLLGLEGSGVGVSVKGVGGGEGVGIWIAIFLSNKTLKKKSEMIGHAVI